MVSAGLSRRRIWTFERARKKWPVVGGPCRKETQRRPSIDFCIAFASAMALFVLLSVRAC